MPYFPDSQQWMHQSTLLLSAYPTTTRITTKYRISPPPPSRKRKAAATSQTDSDTTASTTLQTRTSRAHLVLKTYDPVSGACLKYKTDKAAEVGRLVAALGKCGKVMSGMPLGDHTDMEEGGVALTTEAKAELKEEVVEPKPVTSAKEVTPTGKGGTQGKAGGGGAKKKKGKR